MKDYEKSRFTQLVGRYISCYHYSDTNCVLASRTGVPNLFKLLSTILISAYIREHRYAITAWNINQITTVREHCHIIREQSGARKHQVGHLCSRISCRSIFALAEVVQPRRRNMLQSQNLDIGVGFSYVQYIYKVYFLYHCEK